MHAAIELHDSNLASLTCQDGTAVLVFAPAYIHRWEGRPGIDTGTGWTQEVTFTFADAKVSAPSELPCGLAGGSLTINEVLHDNLVPVEGRFAAPCELRLVFSSGAEPLVIQGKHLIILPQGEATYLEKTPFLEP